MTTPDVQVGILVRGTEDMVCRVFGGADNRRICAVRFDDGIGFTIQGSPEEMIAFTDRLRLAVADAVANPAGRSHLPAREAVA